MKWILVLGVAVAPIAAAVEPADLGANYSAKDFAMLCAKIQAIKPTLLDQTIEVPTEELVKLSLMNQYCEAAVLHTARTIMAGSFRYGTKRICVDPNLSIDTVLAEVTGLRDDEEYMSTPGLTPTDMIIQALVARSDCSLTRQPDPTEEPPIQN